MIQALPLIEIVPDDAHEFFDYEAKYTAGVTDEICRIWLVARDREVDDRVFALPPHEVPESGKEFHDLVFVPGLQ
mgnify:CR=1 FL=1